MCTRKFIRRCSAPLCVCMYLFNFFRCLLFLLSLFAVSTSFYLFLSLACSPASVGRSVALFTNKFFTSFIYRVITVLYLTCVCFFYLFVHSFLLIRFASVPFEQKMAYVQINMYAKCCVHTIKHIIYTQVFYKLWNE